MAIGAKVQKNSMYLVEMAKERGWVPGNLSVWGYDVTVLPMELDDSIPDRVDYLSRCWRESVKYNSQKNVKEYNRIRTKIYNKKHFSSPCKSVEAFSDLLPCDSPEWTKDGEISVVCYLCKKRFIPTTTQVWGRVNSSDIRGHIGGQSNFYCSDSCKNACPVFNHHPQYQDPRIAPEKTDKQKARACQTDTLKQMQCEDTGHNYCERCGDIIDVELHHTLPVSEFGTDAINSAGHMLLCAGCHVELHGECAA